MTSYRLIRLKIDGFTPHTLPVGRLAEYLKDLAGLLSEGNDAHFVKVGEGSAELIHEVPEQNYDAVQSRITAAARGKGPQDAVRSYRDLSLKLRHDQKPAQMLRCGKSSRKS